VSKKVENDRVCSFIGNDDKMTQGLSTLGCPEYILSIAQSISISPVFPYASITQAISVSPGSSNSRYYTVLSQTDE